MAPKTPIEKKLLNKLTPQEQVEFNKLLKTDQSFAEDYKIELDIHQYIKTKMDNQETRIYLKELHRELVSKGTLKENRPTRSLKKYLPFALVASLIGMFVLVNFIIGTSNSPEELYALYYETPPFTETVRSHNDFENLEKAYSNKNYKQVIQIFQNNAKLSANPKLKQYLGISYLEIGQTDEAMIVFRSLQSETTMACSPTWYLALSFLKKGDITNCKEELKKLINGKCTPLREKKARLLLNDL